MQKAHFAAKKFTGDVTCSICNTVGSLAMVDMQKVHCRMACSAAQFKARSSVPCSSFRFSNMGVDSAALVIAATAQTSLCSWHMCM